MSTQSNSDLLNHPLLWRGKDLLNRSGISHSNPTLSSGHPELDGQLQGGGWPQQGLVDLLLPHAGIGELRLILPILETLTQTSYVVWINPPFVPYAAALDAFGVNPRNLLVVQTQTHEETLWSMDRCCLSAGCAAVLAWPEEHKLSIKETRRVQLAARSGHTLAIFFRPIGAAARSSLAELRLALRPTDDVDQLAVDIIKRKGGWPVQNIRLCLDVTRYQAMESLHEQLALWQKLEQVRDRSGEQTKEQEIKQETARGALAADVNSAITNAGLYADFVYERGQPERDTLPIKPLGGLH
jgi:protein ImuA